jgi:hypothetical protein
MGLSLILFVASIVYLIVVVIYRAFFHPLSHIPGPFFASVTYIYQFYYKRLCKNSSFYLQIEMLHNRYGLVVRISPHEVHLSNPAHHQTIHPVGTKFTKDPAYYQTSFASPLSMFTTQDNALHRAPRSVLAPIFTRARVLELEHIVQNKVSKLCNSIHKLLASSEPVDIYHAVRCISLDTIAEYAFDNCRNLLDAPGFATTVLDATKKRPTACMGASAVSMACEAAASPRNGS